MIRTLFFLLICYLIYSFYKMTQKSQEESKIKNLGKAKVAPESSCPNPKTFVDYIEGRIQGKKKQKLHDHIHSCEHCMRLIKMVFDVSSEEELKKIEVPKE